jgi:hypothetical protein
VTVARGQLSNGGPRSRRKRIVPRSVLHAKHGLVETCYESRYANAGAVLPTSAYPHVVYGDMESVLRSGKCRTDSRATTKEFS